MTQFTIATAALNKNDGIMFRSMLQIITAQLTVEWEYQANAKIVLVDIDVDEGVTFWQHPPEQKLLIAYGKENCVQAEWFLTKPLRVKSLVQLLNLLSTSQHLLFPVDTDAVSSPPKRQPVSKVQPLLPPKQPIKEKPITPPHLVDYFDPEQYLIGALKTAQQQQHTIKFQLPNQSPLLFSPARRHCLTDRLQLSHLTNMKVHLYNAHRDEIQQTVVTEAEVEQVYNEDAGQFYSLEVIEWLTALYASQGRLLIKHSPQQLIKLKQWPNLAILPHHPYHIRIAAFMTRNSTTLAKIAEHTGLEFSLVVNFFNACQLHDLIESTTQVIRLPQKPISATKRHLFRGILRRLLQ